MNCNDNKPWSELGPFGIDYEKIYSCQFHNESTMGIILLFLWVCYLINSLGSTASSYFSPNLGRICDKLKLPYDIAGVTLLAFGNGAPDVFSSITSFSGSADVLVGLGALLGGGVFVVTVVVGAISYFCPCEVSRHIFLRDIMFHLLATSCVTIVAVLGYFSLTTAIFLLLLYSFYVLIILALMWMSKKTTESENDIPLTNLSSASIQTAFWHKTVTRRENSRKYASILHTSNSADDDEDDDAFGLDTSSSPHGYTFLILDEDNDNSKNSDMDNNDMISLTMSPSNISPVFDGRIIEDYFGDANGNITSDSESFGSHTSSSLTENLLPYQDGLGCSDDIEAFDHTLRLHRGSSSHSRILTALYWQQLLFQNQLHRQFFSDEWREYSVWDKFLSLVELPLNLLRYLTIPCLDSEQWNKKVAIFQPIFSSILILFAFGDVSATLSNGFPVLIIAIICTLPFCIAIYILTHQYRPPSGILEGVWMFWGFVMCVSWIYALAKELVTCLTSIGHIFGISTSFLGLTVLAWGNSIGDLVANTSVARKGMGEMAIAGCYGGPIFNILVGLGSSFLLASLQIYPRPFLVNLDLPAMISLAFIYIALFSTILIVSMKNFHIDRQLGIYLMSLYLLYSICQIGALFLSA